MSHTLKKSTSLRHSHRYMCEGCKRVKDCSIVGCRGECIKMCVKCVKKGREKG